MTRYAAALTIGIAAAHGEIGGLILLIAVYLWHLANEIEAGVYDVE
jgi:4-hydroxybenzoate polyprenyltransferase